MAGQLVRPTPATKIQQIVVLVDSATAKENVMRLAEKKGCRVTVQEQKGEFRLELTPA